MLPLASAYDLDHDYCLKPPASRIEIFMEQETFVLNQFHNIKNRWGLGADSLR